MRAQWWLVGFFAAVLTLAAARCAPAKFAREALIRPPVAQEDGLIDLRQDGGQPLRRGIPLKPGEGQKRPPCDAEMGEEALRGACYIPVAGRKPPCGRLLEDGSQCFRAVFVAPRQPTSLGR